jgi:putative transposase
MSRADRRYDGHSSIRLPGYDYCVGAFFITLNKSDDGPLFGTIIDGIIDPTAVGVIINDEWQRTATIRNEIELDAFVLMPDHLHAILFFRSDQQTAPVSGHGR